MKDICFLPPFPQRSLGGVVRPDSSSPHRHVSAGPQFHQMYALQPQSGCHLSLCVCVSACFCVFWHKTHLFLAARSIRKQGHRYSSAQRITGSTHAYLELSFHPSKIRPLSAIHLCPLRALVASLITFSESERKRIMSGMVPLYLLHFFLSRGLKKRHGDRV